MAMDKNESKLLRMRYLSVLERLESAIFSAGRKKDEVTLIAVSKLHSAAMVSAVAALGQVDFGENYVQEAIEKRNELEQAGAVQGISWHMIGHVQSRKASLVVGSFTLIHTLDSKHLANCLEKQCIFQDISQKVLIEVNVGEEIQKTGISIKQSHELVDHILNNCPHLILEGLMCIPPVYNGGEAARPYFASLRELCNKLRQYTGLKLPHLSMGMSGDFEWAILEGATYVRVGTDIFGARPLKK